MTNLLRLQLIFKEKGDQLSDVSPNILAYLMNQSRVIIERISDYPTALFSFTWSPWNFHSSLMEMDNIPRYTSLTMFTLWHVIHQHQNPLVFIFDKALWRMYRQSTSIWRSLYMSCTINNKHSNMSDPLSSLASNRQWLISKISVHYFKSLVTRKHFID